MKEIAKKIDNRLKICDELEIQINSSPKSANFQTLMRAVLK